MLVLGCQVVHQVWNGHFQCHVHTSFKVESDLHLALKTIIIREPKNWVNRIIAFLTKDSALEQSHNGVSVHLVGLIEAHLKAVPFENLDQQLGVQVSTAIDRVYEKVVIRRRGGWCFELNGLFGWLLEEIGFDVSMIAAHVGPNKPHSRDDGDHMSLLVECDGPLLVDVGFGGGPNDVIPIRPITVSQPPYTISISREDGGYYKYSEAADGNEGTYWFTLNKVDTSYFDRANHRLQSDPASPFLRTLTAQRRFKDHHLVLRGLIKKTIRETGTSTEQLTDSAALIECLRDDFDLDVPQVSALCSSLLQRHEELFGEDVEPSTHQAEASN